MAFCLLFVVTAVSGVAASAGPGRGRSSANDSKGREARQRFAEAIRDNNNPSRWAVSTNQVRAAVYSGGERWRVTASLSGTTPPIAITKRAPVLIDLHFPLVQPGEEAVLMVLDQGQITVPPGRTEAEQVGRAPGQPQPAKVIATKVRPDRTVRLRYEFGEAYHDQKIQAKVGLARAILNLHLHDGSDH